AGFFRKDEFKYDPETDSFTCPAGQRLTPYASSALRQLKKINYANRKACRDCPLRARLKAPERKSLTEAAGQSGCAGVKLRQQMAFVGKRQGPGDEERGALCSGSLCGSD